MKISFRKVVSAAALAIAAATGSASAPAPVEAAELRMLSGFSPNFVWYREIGPRFIEMVQEKSGGDTTISFTGPDAVPTFEQFQPVQAGVFDLLFTHPAYHSGTTSVGLAIDAIDVDPVKRRDVGIIDYIDQHYMQRGMKLISAPSTGTKGFRYYLREPIDGVPGLNGRIIRGTVSYHPMIKALGGSPLNMPVSEIYTALQRGTVDGAAWGLTGAKDLKWNEIIKYMADPVFGQVGVMIFMNLDSWNALDEKTQNILLEAGREIEVEAQSHFDKLQADEFEWLSANGMEVTSFDPSEGNEFERLWAEGVWEVAAEVSGDDARKLRELAKSHGMTR
ncbi:TRAP transporter substrate-binding protein DctP [Rhodospirillaceae bacterium KN72]|uniref:TRAP transporter substrate-binding protein DctP n=1 Tax=Pacificispira spongiicola TaxID=2729598 RepID=A0A7Y0HF09_9PROT|nr:TRAP transporter substrate-binding protein DctP [Pacificispira spongiicola]NMM45290.1 TRAP transporter substrate-binding protein DctP [Pacificispira spongiicola]